MRTSVRIDLTRLKENYRRIAAVLPSGSAALAVVKANAYGLGAVRVSQALQQAGCRRFAVACHEEGSELRQAGIESEILVLGGFFPGEADRLAENDLTPVLHAEYQVKEWIRAAEKTGKDLPCHLKIDTGMTRLGLPPAAACQAAATLLSSARVRLEGIGTHLASSEDLSDDRSDRQIAVFEDVLQNLDRRGIRPRWIHFANSAAVAYRPLGPANLVRPGLALYGVRPALEGGEAVPAYEVKPVLRWTAKVLAVKQVAAGARIGYGGIYQAERPMRLGILSAGYGDGLRRELAHGGYALLQGRRCSIVGNISMDLTAVDLTAVDGVQPGDEAVLLGDGASPAAMAAACRTTPYEILCGISSRVVRTYSDG